MVDRFVFPSASSLAHHVDDEKLEEARLIGLVIPNSVDLDLFSGQVPARNLNRVVYCSSPDRGLHHLLGIWPEVRKRVPDAELRIFYRLEPWLARARDNNDPVGRRARYIEEAIRRLTAGGFGVTVPGPVPNAQMARELQAASLLVYPCDPVRYTEGFGCSVLDACAAGCLPIISDADALPSVHGSAARVIAGKPGDKRAEWLSVILENIGVKHDDAAMKAHAAAHSRHVIADQWERLLLQER